MKTSTPIDYQVMQSHRLSAQQRRVIVSVQHRGDSEVAEIARHARESISTTRYILAGLEERKIIEAYSPFISTYPLGLVSMTVYLSLVGVSEEKLKSILQDILQNPSVSWVAKLAGPFEYAVAFLTRRGEEVHEAITSIANKHEGVISRKAISTTAAFYANVRRYLAPDVAPPKPFYFGFADEAAEIDSTDIKILVRIATKGMSSNRQLAQELNLSHTTLSRRLAELREKRIIKGIFTRLDMSAYNLSTYRLFLYTSGTSKAVSKAITSFAESELHVLRTIFVLGPWDFELEVEVATIFELNDIIQRLKQRLDRLLLQVETVQIIRHLAYKPFPRIAQFT